jgi:hypothetical protein
MKEAIWLTSTRPSRMLNILRLRRPSSQTRKCRLFAAASCRRIWDLLEERFRRAVVGLESIAEARLAEPEMAVLAREALIAAWDYTDISASAHAAEAVANAVNWETSYRQRGEGIDPPVNLIARVAGAAYHAAHARAFSLHPGVRAQAREAVIRLEESAQADLVREIFGNLYRPAHFDASWRTIEVVELARTIEHSLDFDAMPVLGDALEQSGCSLDEILSHCREPGQHVRGCWVLDLVAGRA